MSTYKSCKWLERGIVFDQSNIVRHCSVYNMEHGGRPIIWENYSGGTNWDELLKIKRENKEKLKNGDCPPTCKDCIFLINKDWDDEDNIIKILLTPWIECNSKCIYCWAPIDNYTHEHAKKYDITKVIANMIENNLLIKTAGVDFAGGEPTLYEDFEELLNLFIKNDFEDIAIHTNAIEYSNSIAEGIKKGIVNLLVSIDAGTKKMHEVIKGVESYDKVWANLKRYIQAQNGNNNQVRTKYIIVPDINDKKEEIDLWLNKSLDCGIKSVTLNLDQGWLTDNLVDNNNIMPLYNLMSYTIDRTKELNMDIELYTQISQIKRKVEKDIKITTCEAV